MKKTIAAMIAGVFATSVYAQTTTPAAPAAPAAAAATATAATPAAPAAAAAPAAPAAKVEAKKSKDVAKATVAESKAGKKDEKSHH